MATAVQNVVLLSVDALRADHLSCYGYHRETTPALDDLADHNLRFTNAYSVSSHTREAVPGLVTGQFPDEAIDTNYQLAVEPVSSRLSREGYATAAFHSNPYLSRAFGYDRDFDTFDDDLHLGKHKFIALAQRALDKLRNRHYARASEINDRSLSWIDSRNEDPFFLWNHYMDPHGPYLPPKEYQHAFTDRTEGDRQRQRLYKRAVGEPDSITDRDRSFLIDSYDAEIQYTDAQIASFLDELDDRDVLDDTLVIVTADHGDAFGEHGYYSHPRYLDEEVTHVPMIVRGPGIDSGKIETPVSTLDVVPTILHACGIESSLPGEPIQELGDWAPERRDRTVFAQAAGVDEDSNLRRYAAWRLDGRAFGTHDTESDTLRISEQSDETTADRLREHVKDRLEAVERARTSESATVNDEIEQRLSALGYKE